MIKSFRRARDGDSRRLCQKEGELIEKGTATDKPKEEKYQNLGKAEEWGTTRGSETEDNLPRTTAAKLRDFHEDGEMELERLYRA